MSGKKLLALTLAGLFGGYVAWRIDYAVRSAKRLEMYRMMLKIAKDYYKYATENMTDVAEKAEE